jgi:hypothetical protein
MGVIAVAVCREKVAFEPEDNPLQKTLIKYEWSETPCKKAFCSAGRNFETVSGMKTTMHPIRMSTVGGNMTALADHKNIFSFIAVPGDFHFGLKENYIFTSAFSKSA